MARPELKVTGRVISMPKHQAINAYRRSGLKAPEIPDVSSN
jgi:hypothetical protein